MAGEKVDLGRKPQEVHYIECYYRYMFYITHGNPFMEILDAFFLFMEFTYLKSVLKITNKPTNLQNKFLRPEKYWKNYSEIIVKSGIILI